MQTVHGDIHTHGYTNKYKHTSSNRQTYRSLCTAILIHVTDRMTQPANRQTDGQMHKVTEAQPTVQTDGRTKERNRRTNELISCFRACSGNQAAFTALKMANLVNLTEIMDYKVSWRGLCYIAI